MVSACEDVSSRFQPFAARSILFTIHDRKTHRPVLSSYPPPYALLGKLISVPGISFTTLLVSHPSKLTRWPKMALHESLWNHPQHSNEAIVQAARSRSAARTVQVVVAGARTGARTDCLVNLANMADPTQ